MNLPKLISFSGGQSSAYMLHLLLPALTINDRVVFADTGREMPETYEFIHNVEREFGVKIHWVGRAGGFDKLIEDRNYLPGAAFRFCTGDLKIKPMTKFMKAEGFKHYDTCIGIRYDEPNRYYKLKDQTINGGHYIFPLWKHKVTKEIVNDFWDKMPFKLNIPNYAGNCDFCFMKTNTKLKLMFEQYPERGQKWIDDEEKTGQCYKIGTPMKNIRDLLKQNEIDFESTINCFCGE